MAHDAAKAMEYYAEDFAMYNRTCHDAQQVPFWRRSASIPGRRSYSYAKLVEMGQTRRSRPADAENSETPAPAAEVDDALAARVAELESELASVRAELQELLQLLT